MSAAALHAVMVRLHLAAAGGDEQRIREIVRDEARKMLPLNRAEFRRLLDERLGQ